MVNDTLLQGTGTAFTDRLTAPGCTTDRRCFSNSQFHKLFHAMGVLGIPHSRTPLSAQETMVLLIHTFHAMILFRVDAMFHSSCVMRAVEASSFHPLRNSGRTTGRFVLEVWGHVTTRDETAGSRTKAHQADTRGTPRAKHEAPQAKHGTSGKAKKAAITHATDKPNR